MKNLKSLIILTVIFLFGASVSAQTADEIIAKYLNAIGGKEQLAKVTSIYTESKADIMGMETIMKATTLNGKGYKMEMEIQGSVITTCFTDNGGWSVNPMAGSTSAEPMPETQYNAGKDQIFIGAPFTIYQEKGYKAELLGNEAVGDVNALKVKMTGPDNTSSVYFFDPGTGYLIKSISQGDMQGQTVENVTTFSDYKQTDGYTIPYKVSLDMGGMFELTSNVTKVEINKPVDPSFFAKP